MTTRRKRDRDCLEGKKVETEKGLQNVTYTGNSKRKRSKGDYADATSDSCKLLKCLSNETSSTNTSQRATKSYGRLVRNISTDSLPDRDNGVSNFRSRVTKTYASPKKNAASVTDEGRPSGSPSAGGGSPSAGGGSPSASGSVSTSGGSVLASGSVPDNHTSEFKSENIQVELVKKDSEGENGGVSMLHHGKRSTTVSRHSVKSIKNTDSAAPPLNNHCLSNETSTSTSLNNDCKPSEQSLNSDNCKIIDTNNITPLSSEHHDVTELALTKANSNDLVATSRNIPLTYNFSTIAPVLQPMYGAGVPSSTHHHLTSAIAAISTPITTVPILPEIANGVPLGAVGVSSSSTYQEVHITPPTPLTASSEKHISHGTSNSDIHQHVQGNGVQFSPKVNIRIDEKDKKTVDTEEDKNTCDNHSSVTSCNCRSGSLSVEESDDPAPSDSSNSVSTSPNFLQIENWGTYLLQRLEYLYEKEQECDLILKFYGGETLKVHRAVMVACTSLVSNQDPAQCRSEFAVPPDLSYSHVEPVIRFVYSGRLDTHGLHEEMRSIYTAAHRLQVPLLTRLMDSRFPHLAAPTTPPRRLPIWKRNPKLHPQSRENARKKCSKFTEAGKKSHSSTHKTTSHRTISIRKTSNTGEMDTEEEECERQDGSMYLLVPKSKNTLRADGVFRSKFTPEKARPTRFELEEDSEHSHVQIATWSSKTSSVPPFFPPASHTQTRLIGPSYPTPASSSASLSPFDAILASSTPLYSSLQLGNVDNTKMSAPEVDRNRKTQSEPDPSTESEDKDTNLEIRKIIDSIDVSSPSEEVKDENEKDMHVNDGDESLNICEVCDKIPCIHKQHEEKGTAVDNDNEEAFECKPETDDQDHINSCKQAPQDTDGEASKDSKDPMLANNTDIPAKSILKKKKDRQAVKEKKHVSFPLNENDEVINEVATYSHAKEPAQSLIEVKKNIGSLKPTSDTYSPVKVTLSLKKKVLMNVSLGDSEGSEIKGIEKMKLSKKESVQSSSQDQTSKGDLSNHAKLISEVLKKYPHLVKDKKNVRLKILKKGNEKGNGGKVVKSKVHYLVLSEGDSKGKSGKLSKSLGKTSAKNDPVTSGRAITNYQSFQCPECGSVFQSYFTFKKHVTSDHKDQSTTILASVENVPYACYTCFLNEPLEFSDYYSYQQHMQEIHSNTETRVCNICGFRPKRKLELAYHQYSEHNKVPRNFTFPKCDLCDFVAMNDAALLKHRSQHANADSYTCSSCGVTFCSFGALQGHMQTKLCQSKPTTSYKCPHCDLTFARSYSLKVHCKSSHRSAQTSVQVVPVLPKDEGDSKPQASLLAESENEKPSEATTSTSREQRAQDGGNMTAITTQPSSEAEALSTVASSLVASLELPEETVNQYMYTQGCTLEEEKGNERVNGPEGVSIQLVDATTPVSGYQEDHSLCQNTTFTAQAPMPSTTNVGTLYPVSVVSNQLVANQVVPGQILPSQLLQSGCISTTGGSVLGPVPHSWTYVTYQVPSPGDDLPTVIAEATSINTASVTSHQEATPDTSFQAAQDLPSHQQVSMEVTETDKSGNNAMGNCEQLDSLVVVTNTATQVDNINQSSIFL